MLDTCVCGEGQALTLCHTTCQLGSREPSEVLNNIVTFLERNPSEVIVLEFQLHNADLAIYELYRIMSDVPGLTESMYYHEHKMARWPRLGDLITANKVTYSLVLLCFFLGTLE